MTTLVLESSTVWWECHGDKEPMSELVCEGDSEVHRGGRRVMLGPPTGVIGSSGKDGMRMGARVQAGRCAR